MHDTVLSATRKISAFIAQNGFWCLCRAISMHTEKSSRYLIKSNRNQIVFTFFRLIWYTNGLRPFAVPNQSENGKYNLISGWFNKISLCVHSQRYVSDYYHIQRNTIFGTVGLLIMNQTEFDLVHNWLRGPSIEPRDSRIVSAPDRLNFIPTNFSLIADFVTGIPVHLV